MTIFLKLRVFSIWVLLYPSDPCLGLGTVGTMLRRRRSCRKKQLRLKLPLRDDEGIIHEASGL
jgi:hypothetical protein